MRRRHALGVLSSVIFGAGARSSVGQSPGRLYKLGHLSLSAESEALTRTFALPQLAAMGFVAGQNLIFEARIGGGDNLRSLADELLSIKPDAIITIGAQATKVTRAATSSVPIFMFADDPVALGVA